MFGLNSDVMRVYFTLDERDLALALAEMEGCYVVDESGKKATPLAAAFGWGRTKERRVGGVEPMQERPGVFSYRVRRTKNFCPFILTGSSVGRAHDC